MLSIMIAGHFTAFWHEPAWIRALTEMGHKVTCFNMSEEISSPYERFQFRVKQGPKIDEANEKLIAAAIKDKPDIIVCYRALAVYAATVKELRERTQSLLVCYNNDNPFSSKARYRVWRHFRNAIPYYQLHLVFRHSDISNYKQAGASKVRVLRHQYLPWLHRKLDRGSKDRDLWMSDIGFFGHCEPDERINQMTELMKRLPAKYRLHGSKWDKYSHGRPWHKMDTHEIQGEEYVRAINATKIALCFLSQYQNKDVYTTRCFEIPACGTMMLSQRTEDLTTLYEEDKEAVFFSSADELVEKASFYLKRDSFRERIAEAGFQRCKTSGYDIYSRMDEWLAVAKRMSK